MPKSPEESFVANVERADNKDKHISPCNRDEASRLYPLWEVMGALSNVDARAGRFWGHQGRMVKEDPGVHISAMGLSLL